MNLKCFWINKYFDPPHRLLYIVRLLTITAEALRQKKDKK